MLRSDLLIRTKLHPPFIRPTLVQRPRLQALLEVGLQGPLTLVIAPAGFGKTTLVAASLAECEKPAAWLSLDRDDNQGTRFLVHLIAALQGVDDRIGAEAAQLLAGVQPAPPQAILTSLINDLDAIDTESILVLDDYQFITNLVIHDSLAFLLEHHPQKLHLVVASRSDPPLPLARLRARGQMVELRVADLRFTASETALFLNEIMKLDLDADSVSVLEQRTEGWIAGLQMAALSMRDHDRIRGFIEGFSGTNRHILDYLLEEILAGQPPEVQRFLLFTSILERLSAPLCQAVISNETIEIRDTRSEMGDGSRLSHLDSQATLEYLERENLFLVPLDDKRVWFRYHHLFADLLRARLHRAYPGLADRLHLRACDWLEANGFLNDAIRHLLAASEIGRAADMIERYGPAQCARNDPSILQMVELLPPEMLIDRPKIGLCQAWLMIILGHIEKAVPLMNALRQSLAGPAAPPGKEWMQTIISLALAFLARPDKPPESDPFPDLQDLAAIPVEELVLRDAAYILYGMALGRRGELERAVEISEQVIHKDRLSHGTLAIPTLVPFLTRVYLMQGRLNAAASLCRDYLDPIKQKGFRFMYSIGNLEIDFGETLYEWNHLEEAEKFIRDGLRDNEPWDNIMTLGFGLCALIRVLMAKGYYLEAMQTVEKFESRMLGRSHPREFEEEILTLRVRVHLAAGNLLKAVHWADQIQHRGRIKQPAGFYRLTLARIRLAQGRYLEAERILSDMEPTLVGGNRIARKLEMELLLAAAAAGQNHIPEAVDRFDSCLAIAEPEGYLQVFLQMGKPAQELLATYLRSASAGHKVYAQQLLRAFTTAPSVAPVSQAGGLIESLSGREIEVLQLMALGQTNQEIARRLIVSPGTVKAHTASIYRKLDVANRTEAVARARQLSIIE